jgi:hypothetical protein
MTSIADTAELPRVRRWDSPSVAPVPVIESPAPALDPGPLVIDPPVAMVAPVAPVVVVPVPGRLELRAERRLARRQRQFFALIGLSVLITALAVTVVVLDVIR